MIQRNLRNEKAGCKNHHTEIYFCVKLEETNSPGSRRSTQHMKPEAASVEEEDNPSTDSVIWQLSATLTFTIQLMPYSCLLTDNIYEVIKKRYSN